jgi:hypothetical protein
LKEAVMGFVGQFFLIEVMDEPKIFVKTIKVKKVLEDFATIFKEPKSIPLMRRFDHKISLKLGAQLVTCRPYKSIFFLHK